MGKDAHQSHFQKGEWSDFREEVKAVEPELFDIIDSLSPDKEYPLIKVSYQYGEYITDFGTICIPDTKGNTVRLDDPTVSSVLKQQLGYCPTPLVLQLSRTSEVFVKAGKRIIPLNVFYPGDMYGLFEILVPYTQSPIAPCWSVTAGSRSAFMGPKITDTVENNRLKRAYRINPDDAQDLSQHWHLFKRINQQTKSLWYSEVLLFTNEWFRDRNDSIEWLLFQKYLFKKAWIQSRNIRVTTEYSILWESFVSEVSGKNYKLDAYTASTLMHLLFIANATIPGFRPVCGEDDMLLPLKVIEHAYEEVYGMLRDYAPIVLAPAIFEARRNCLPVYYSFAYPTLIESAFIKAAPYQSTMKIMRQVKPLMQMLEAVLAKQQGELYRLMQNANFRYYHFKPDERDEILSTKALLVDPDIEQYQHRFKGKLFPIKGPFFRGCCRIACKSAD